MPKSLQKKVKTTVSKDAEQSTQASLEKKRTLIDKVNALSDKDKMELMELCGLGSKYFTCYKCGRVLKKTDFYASTDLKVKTHISPICKQCASDIACPVDPKTNEKMSPTKETCQEAIFYLNRVWTEDIWNSSLLEAANTMTGKTKNNVWNSLTKNTILPQNAMLTWRDSDFFNNKTSALSGEMSDDIANLDKVTLEQFEKNRADVIRLLGYEPFEKEKLSDQPFLYSQLVGFLDSSEDANEDMMRTSSAITIVRGFLQNSHIDNMIAKLMQDPINAEKNVGTIKALQDMKQKVSSTITSLAEQSCISLKHNKNAKKGEDTWTGKVRKLKEMNLREAEVNGFDLGTCKGMRQVADISNASIMQQLKLDENDYTEMIIQQKELILQLREASEQWEERARILLRENIDLKEYLSSLNALDPSMLQTFSILTEEGDEIEVISNE